MQGSSGYLVVYSQKQQRIATLYDEFLNYIADIDPESEDAMEHIETAEYVDNLHNEMWEEVLGELTPEEREHAVAYRLQRYDSPTSGKSVSHGK
ncbi:MAG TPA: hypothetical protein VFX01_00350 [Methylophilaceae bacterium]|nr:hypothetical protein [Methylophilaceae bacterium]